MNDNLQHYVIKVNSLKNGCDRTDVLHLSLPGLINQSTQVY